MFLRARMPSGSFVLALAFMATAVHCKSKSGDKAGPATPPSAVVAAPVPTPASLLPALVVAAPPVRASSSTIALGRVADVLYAFVADEDAHTLTMVNVATGALVDTLPLSAAPGHVVVHRAGLAVALRDTTEVRTVTVRGDAATPKLMLDEATLEVPLDPLALLSRGDALLVASAASATLAEARRAGVAETKAPVRLPRDPRAILATEGGTIHVTHATGSTVTSVGPAGERHGLDMSLGETCTEAMIDECMTTVNPPSLQSYAVAAYGKYLLVPSVSSLTDGPLPSLAMVPPAPHEQADPLVRNNGQVEPSHSLDTLFNGSGASGGYGGGNTSLPITFRVDVLAGAKAPHQLSHTTPDNRFGVHDCTLPRGIAVDEAGAQFWVACLGEGKVVRHAVKETPRSLDVRPKDSVAVAGVTAVAFDAAASVLVAHAPFARTLSFFAIEKGKAGAPRTVALPALAGERAMSPALLRGRELFFTTDRRISRGKKACASCHPDGGDDGLAWPSPEGKRRTLALAGRLGEEGFGWRGKHDTLETHIKNTITVNLHGKGLPEADLAALATWVRSMKAPAARPLSAEAARGKVIFSGPTADCATCHVPSHGFSDGLPHDVGGGAFRTPSLIGVAGRGRYAHDGRYRTLEELFAGTNGKMGQTAALSPADRAALAAYVETL